MMLMRGIVAIAIVLSGLAFLAPSTVAQSASDDETSQKAAAAQAIGEVLEFAAAGDYAEMYERLHPDSQSEVPESVALNLFADVYSIAQADEAIIVGISLGELTWPVNGETYTDSAVVTVVIPVIDETGARTWIEDTFYLTNEQGGWRWFLGSSSEFVDSINQDYAGVPAPSTDSSEITAVPRDQFLQVVVNDLDAFYRDVVSFTGADYESPGVVVVAEGTSAQSACGPAQTGFLGFYCPLDATIYLDEPFLLDLYDQGNDFAAAFVVAHEWAHHVQTGLGIERTTRPDDWNELHSIELELMADCFSGAWALDADSRGLLETGDIEEAANLIVYDLGDPKWVDEFAPQSHGTGEQRIAAFMNGYELGFLGCNIQL